jgi:hypothetical protein
MALTVEDGSGLSNADSFASVAEFKTFCTGRGYVIEDFENAQIEAQLRLGFDWINTKHRYKGDRKLINQAGEFPRVGLTDWSNYTIEGLPNKVKQANCELAFKGLGGASLYEDLSRGGMIKSESVGPISTTYADGAPGGTVFTYANNLLAQYIKDASSVQMRPGYAQPADVIFDIAMTDNVDGGATIDPETGE